MNLHKVVNGSKVLTRDLSCPQVLRWNYVLRFSLSLWTLLDTMETLKHKEKSEIFLYSHIYIYINICLSFRRVRAVTSKITRKMENAQARLSITVYSRLIVPPSHTSMRVAMFNRPRVVDSVLKIIEGTARIAGLLPAPAHSVLPFSEALSSSRGLVVCLSVCWSVGPTLLKV